MRENLWEDITAKLDIRRIRSIPVSEKFQAVEYIKLVSQEAKVAQEKGYAALRESEYFTKDNTYRMLAALVSKEVPFEEIRFVVRNYLANFTDSDAYYAKFAILGMGILLMRDGIDSKSIFNLLLSLLGGEFIVQNLNLYGYKEALETEPNPESVIRYKEYDMRYRETKYELLALNLMHQEDSLDMVSQYIFDIHEKSEIQLFYEMMYDVDPIARKEIVRRLYRTKNDFTQMVVVGVDSLLGKKSLMLSHYLMNSIIGKYTHFDQRPEIVEAEVKERKEKMKKQIEAETNRV